MIINIKQDNFYRKLTIEESGRTCKQLGYVYYWIVTSTTSLVVVKMLNDTWLI